MTAKDQSGDIKKRRKALILVVVLLISFFVLEHIGITSLLNLPTEKIFTPISLSLYKTKMDFKEIFSTFAEAGDLRKQKTKLSFENALLKAQVASLRPLERENDTLREQLGAAKYSSKLVLADVVGEDPLLSSDNLIIDKGSSSGVSKGDLVVIKDILIGQVSQTNRETARIRLLSDSNTKIPSQTESGVKGLLTGQFGHQVILDHVEQGKKLSKGEFVFTSGQSDILKDLVIGTISEIDNDPAALFQNALIEPLLDYEKIETVFVIIR